MGSHRARHRADQNQSEELATDLLARLADEGRPRPARRRSTTSRPALDPFSTAPFPAHPPQTAAGDAVPREEGPSGAEQPTPDDGPGDEANGTYSAGYVPAPRFPTDPGAAFPLDDATDFGAPFPRYAEQAGMPTAPRTGHDRLAVLRRKPVYAAVSVSMITAAAAAAAAAGPAAITPPAPTPAPAGSPALAAAAMGIGPAPKPGQQPAPVVPQVAGGAAVLAPGQGSANAPDNSPVLGSSIAARAAADAKAYAAEQARQAARRAPAAPKPAPKPAVLPAATPAAGTGVSARALGLARGKLGDPYVWGAAGPSAFDCSGLIVWAYKQLGVSLPHSSATLSTMGTPVPRAALQPGDLVFFYSPVSHVGIYAGNGMVLNATQSGEPVQYSKLANLPFHNAVRITT